MGGEHERVTSRSRRRTDVRSVSNSNGTGRESRDADERMTALAVSGGEIIWTTPPNGLADDMPAWRAFTGQTQAEVKGRGWLLALHPDDRERISAAWASAVANRAVFTAQCRLRRHDAVYRTVWVRAVPVMAADETVREWVGCCTDITSYQQDIEGHSPTNAPDQAEISWLPALQEVTDTALTHLAEPQLMGELLGRIRHIMGVDNAAILLLDDDGTHLSLYSVDGPESAVREQVHVPLGRGVAGRIVSTGEPRVIDDLTQVEVANPFLRENLRSLAGVPLKIEDRVIGALHIDSTRTHRFTERDALLLQMIADRIALALDRAALLNTAQAARAEAETRARELEATLEAMSDAVMVFGAAGEVVRMNAAARKLLALPAHPDFYARPLGERGFAADVTDEQDHTLQPEQWPFTRTLRGETLTGDRAVDVRYHVPGHEAIQVNVSGAPVRDATGAIVAAVCVIRDVTERRKLERQTREALTALLAMAEVLVVLPGEALPPHGVAAEETMDVAQRLVTLIRSVVGCQRAAIHLIERDTEVMVPLAAAGLTPETEKIWHSPPSSPAHLGDGLEPASVDALRAGQVVMIDYTRPPFDSRPNPYGLHVVPLVPMRIGNDLVGILSLDFDDADHHYTAHEQALASAAAKLAALAVERERLLRERAEAQARALALHEANLRMNEFLSIASHELKTPVTVIRTNIEILARRLKPEQMANMRAEDVARAVATIGPVLTGMERSGNRLRRLVDDLVDASRIRAGKLDLRLQVCDLADIVRDCVEEQRHLNSRRTIGLRLPEGETVSVMGDPDRIDQVVTNYLTNALKYSAEDRPVEVRLDVERDHARVSVRDEGPGLPPAEQESIWEIFHRSDNVEVQSGSGVGLGLGLHIARTIVERHHGQVGVESAPGVGSTFWFTLPLARPDERDA